MFCGAQDTKYRNTRGQIHLHQSQEEIKLRWRGLGGEGSKLKSEQQGGRAASGEPKDELEQDPGTLEGKGNVPSLDCGGSSYADAYICQNSSNVHLLRISMYAN